MHRTISTGTGPEIRTGADDREMSELKEISTIEEFENCIAESQDHPIFIMKHSTRCPTSSAALDQYAYFSSQQSETPEVFYYVDIIKHRDVSSIMEEQFGVRHESPQIFLLTEGTSVWHTSHWNITAENLSEALKVRR